MQGHAGANMMPVVAANRVGHEDGRAAATITFYGSSFITDGPGEIVEAGAAQRRGGADRDRSTSTRWPRHGRPGACSATAAPTSTCPILSLDGQDPSHLTSPGLS